MKCIQCGQDCKYSERPDKKCPHCKHAFAFEPRKGDPLTDAMMQSAIDTVSAQGTIRFGAEHVYYEVCRRKHRILRYAYIVVPIPFLFFAVAAVCFVPSPWRWIAPPVLIGIGALCAYALRERRLVPMHRTEFDRLWWLWCETHGKPKGLIVRKEMAATPPPLEADVGDYSFDRAVICDTEATVDLLLANQFHFENNCAVLSIDGYPQGIFTIVRDMLKRNPHLQVFVLHDATIKGCRLAHKLATDPDWFGTRIKVFDVGLRPVHAHAFKGLWLESGKDVQPGDGISAHEAKWLAAYSLALAAVRPEQVLKRLFRAINRQFDPHEGSGGNGGGTSGDGTAASGFDSDASDADGGADAFG